MFADQTADGGCHGLHIQFIGNMPAILPTDGTDPAADLIAIAAAAGAVPAVKIVRHRFCAENAYIARQQAVAAVDIDLWIPNAVAVKIDHLSQRVHAAVGAAGAVNPDRLCGQPAQGRFHRSLHRALLRLQLPTVKMGAVIFEH
ncbi:MAG: hypothetical protein BWY83_02341 [bacterium ADurb.Bin478]|nr:MAG: hypothetical protein BWY83_02341 [bacterium ADurb.Bin478]